MLPSSTHPVGTDPVRPRSVRVAAIDFLNPAPLMWDFEHPPLAPSLLDHYTLRYTHPARCAEDLLLHRADLGLIPIAALTPELSIVPGCTIAALDHVRSIQLVVKHQQREQSTTHHAEPLASIRTIAADTASRSSLVYAQILFRKFLHTDPIFHPAPADPIAMLTHHDAALLIGDPALLALQSRIAIEHAVGPCTWYDLAHEWHTRTSLPWVAAVWAVHPEALASTPLTPAQLTDDLNESRTHGLANIQPLVREWTPRIAVPPATIQHYLTHNIHYTLDDACIEAITLFRQYAAECDLLPPLPTLRFL